MPSHVALETNDTGRREELATASLEIASAIQNNRRPPAPARLDLIQLPWVVWGHWQNPIARGRTTAAIGTRFTLGG